MRKLFLIGCLLISGYLSADECPAECYEDTGHFYVGVLGGKNFSFYRNFSQGNSNGYFCGVFSGYKFSNNLRLEGELYYARSNKKKVRVYDIFWDSYTSNCHTERACIMGNTIYEIDIPCEQLSGIRPYFGVGMGYGYIREIWDRYLRDNTIHEFVWQGIAGLAYTIDRYTVGIDYRRIDLCNSAVENSISLSIARAF